MDRVPVSVVIPCFRCAGTIAAALASARNQTAEALEVIVVDDASDDATADTLSALRGRYGESWLKVIRLPRNAGPASARNAGWDAAKGDYIAFLDADDTWHPKKLELQVRIMDRNPAISVSGHLHVVAAKALDQPVSDDPPIVPIGLRDLLWTNRFITSSAMVRRDVAIRFPIGQRYMEDHRLWLETARRAEPIVRIEEALAAHHKADFGAGGLSAHLMAMEKAELGNYFALYREGALALLHLSGFTIWSLAKFVRRVIIVAGRQLIHARVK